jgi:asparagine synthase (glutamine-hydrolysing)
MCGINGFNRRDEALIKEMNEVTKNRGPDDQGIWIDDLVSLGHNRLSIIDLSERGHQPMGNEDGTIWITYNGEIYNFHELRQELEKLGHKFRSNTDTEVIIHAYEQYGFNCLKKFDGMWAFCIYDINNRLLFLSRDQFGIKPLYYYLDADRFIFSSMISAILCHDISTAPNDRIIMAYLAHNLEDWSTETFFEQIFTLSPGHLLVFQLDSKQSKIERWYDPATKILTPDPDLRKIFFKSVASRLIADVPVGSCLSGGIDSSAIVGVINRLLERQFDTFSLVVPGTPIDESEYIREVGARNHIRQFFTEIQENEFLDEIRDFIKCQEEPVIQMSPYAQYRVMKLAHQHRAKVLLDGQGGDEIFAGYIYYFSYYYYELFCSLHWVILVKEMISYVKNFKNYYPIFMFAFIMMPDIVKIFFWERFFTTWVNHKYLKKVDTTRIDPRWNRMSLREGLLLTLAITSIPHLLRREDKSSMRWSIECRPPFLDCDLVEVALSLPSHRLLKDGRTKVIFRESIADLIPDKIRKRTDKIGFAAPSDVLFRTPAIADFCRDLIFSESFRTRPYWKWETVCQLFDDHQQNKRNIGETIWKWINLELWLQEFFPGPNQQEVNGKKLKTKLSIQSLTGLVNMTPVFKDST